VRAAGQSVRSLGGKREKETEQVPAGVGESVDLRLQASLCLFLLEERLQLALFEGRGSAGEVEDEEEEEEDLRELLRRTARVPGEWLAGQTFLIACVYAVRGREVRAASRLLFSLDSYHTFAPLARASSIVNARANTLTSAPTTLAGSDLVEGSATGRPRSPLLGKQPPTRVWQHPLRCPRCQTAP
jgi:hypothetical protein